MLLPMLSIARAIESRRDRFDFARSFRGTSQDTVVAEFGASRRLSRNWRTPIRLRRIDDGIQPREPAVALFVANRRHHYEIARASGGHVQQADCFLFVAAM